MRYPEVVAELCEARLQQSGHPLPAEPVTLRDMDFVLRARSVNAVLAKGCSGHGNAISHLLLDGLLDPLAISKQPRMLYAGLIALDRVFSAHALDIEKSIEKSHPVMAT